MTADRPVVALVHGLEDGPASWQPLMRLADPGWRFVPLEMPWRAGNDYGWRRRRSPGGWLAEALDGLDGPAVAVVGHSFGANAVLELLASDHPPKMAAAVLAAPFFLPSDVPISWQVFDRARENFDRQIADGLVLRLGHRAAGMDADVLQAMIAKTVDRIGPAGFLAVFNQFIATAELPLREVTVPTLVLAGRGDPSLGKRRAAAMADAMPAATVEIEDCYDHFCHVRQGAKVALRISGFLDAHCALHTGWEASCPPSAVG